MQANADQHAIKQIAERTPTRRARRWIVVAIAVATVANVVPVHVASAAAADPRSTYAGVRLTVKQAARAAYDAGFRSEKSLLAVISIGIAESGLVSKARNWHPEYGYRPATAKIGVTGPASAWNRGHTRQMHSDRGAWQVSSRSWSRYKDQQTDNPASAAKIMFSISRRGTDFAPWDTYTSGDSRRYYDVSHDGWPAIRPVVKAFLASVRK